MTEKVKINELRVYIVSTQEYEIRTEVLDNVAYMVVPVVMMVEGVHSGNHGPLLHLAEELGKYPQSWDGIPVTISHPIDSEGRSISANSPEVLEQWSAGRVFNTYMDGIKLRAEAWLDEQKLIAISPEALQYIQEGRHLEVSVGTFTDEEEVSGTFVNTNGESEEYIAIARNLRPDHLALLPGEAGACGWSDGCGIRANSSSQIKEKEALMNPKVKEEKVIDPKIEKTKVVDNEKIVDPIVVVPVEDDQSTMILTMKKQAITDFLATIVDNKQGYLELLNKIQEKLDSLDTDSTYHYVEELYDDAVVYRMRNYRDKITETYRQPFQLDANEAVEFIGEREQVRRSVEYVQVNKIEKKKITNVNKEKGKTMDKPCCLEKVVQLIGNKQTKFTDKDKDWLLELDEKRLESLIPVEVEPVDNTVQVNMEDFVEKSTLGTFESFIPFADDGVKEELEKGKELYVQHRSDLIANILASSQKDVWTEEDLQKHDMVMLEKLSKQFPEVHDYSGQGPANELGKKKDKKLLPPGLKIAK